MSIDMQKLIQAIRDHSGMENDQIREAGQYGADAGWPGFTYTQDCVAFYEQNKGDIWKLLADLADGMGMSPLGLLASFNRADEATDPSGLATLLAWFALEEAGRWLEDNPMADDDDDDEDEDEDDEDGEDEET